jgi:hypothetical protein
MNSDQKTTQSDSAEQMHNVITKDPDKPGTETVGMVKAIRGEITST